MGVISGLLGTAGGANGSGFAAPSSANILNPSTVAQANQQYGTANAALQQQNAFANAVAAQNGIQNQSQVFNQLGNVANGTGANPAQAQLAQATQANVANQAAQAAGQRGSSQNVGLLARQAAQTGAATQQQAAGQAATLQANQSLNALGQQGQIAGQQVANQANATNAYSTATQGEQNNILNGIAGQNNANVGMQSNVNSTNSSLANAQVSGQQNLLGNITGGLGSGLGLFAQGGQVQKMASGGQAGTYDNTLGNYDFSQQPIASDATNPTAAPSPLAAAIATSAPTYQTAPQSAVPNTTPQSNAGKHMNGLPTTPSTPGQQPNYLGNAASGLGHAIGAGIKSLFTSGSSTATAAAPMSNGNPNAPVTQNAVGDVYNPSEAMQAEDQMNADTQMGSNNPSTTQAGPDISQSGMAANGGQAGKAVPAMVSPGEVRIKAKDVQKVAEGKKSALSGEKIPGQPKVGGAVNSYANDTVPKTLKEGDVIIPRAVTKSKNPSAAAQRFVQAIAAKHGMKVMPHNPKKGK